MGSNVALELISIGKSFKKSPAFIENINMRVTKAQVVALIGSSGSGKTTILQIAGLLDKPTSGLCINFTYLLQELSVLENVILPQLIAGKSKTEATKNAQTILEKFGLEKKTSSMISEISGGE
nr:ATP-binding cassette domain-containing protein [Wolbachia endosymbiont of Atemnus politus]